MLHVLAVLLFLLGRLLVVSGVVRLGGRAVPAVVVFVIVDLLGITAGRPRPALSAGLGVRPLRRGGRRLRGRPIEFRGDLLGLDRQPGVRRSRNLDEEGAGVPRAKRRSRAARSWTRSPPPIRASASGIRTTTPGPGRPATFPNTMIKRPGQACTAPTATARLARTVAAAGLVARRRSGRPSEAHRAVPHAAPGPRGARRGDRRGDRHRLRPGLGFLAGSGQPPHLSLRAREPKVVRNT